MGQRLAPSNIGISPWTDYHTAQKNLSSGDLILLSARSLYGKTIRFTNRAAWSHVGIIVKSQFLSETYVLEVVIDRESLYNCCCQKTTTIMKDEDVQQQQSSPLLPPIPSTPDTSSGDTGSSNNDENSDSQQQQESTDKPLDANRKNKNSTSKRMLMFGTQLQPLRSILYSGLYDLVAYRKIRWKKNLTMDDIEAVMRNKFPPNHSTCENVVEYSNTNIGNRHSGYMSDSDEGSSSSTRSLYSSIEDYLTCRLLNFSNQKMQVEIHPQKFEETLSSLFQDDLILSASVDDIRCLASAECVASIFFKLGIFTSPSASTLIPRFIAGHFGVVTPYYLPFNPDLVDRLSKEHYIYTDFQIWLPDVQIRTLPKFPEFIPPIKISYMQTFNTDPAYLRSLRLKSGDLIFFREEGLIGESALKLQGGNYTRVSMVVCFPGINKIFLLDAPSWYVTRKEIEGDVDKVLEQRIVTLDGVLTGGAFSRVAIRRLLKDSKVSVNISTKIYSYLRVTSMADDVARSRIVSLFDGIEQDYGPLLRFDVSSVLSGHFVAMTYSQIGLLPSHETGGEHFVYKTSSVWESQTLADGYRLGDEEILHGTLIVKRDLVQ